MPKLNFELPAQYDSEKAYSKIETFLKAENNFKKFDSKLTTTFDQTLKTCHIKGSQFSASLQVKPKPNQKKSEASDSDCLVVIDVEIPFAMTLFKGKIKEEIEKAFKKVLS